MHVAGSDRRFDAQLDGIGGQPHDPTNARRFWLAVRTPILDWPEKVYQPTYQLHGLKEDAMDIQARNDSPAALMRNASVPIAALDCCRKARRKSTSAVDARCWSRPSFCVWTCTSSADDR